MSFNISGQEILKGFIAMIYIFHVDAGVQRGHKLQVGLARVSVQFI